jgi:hypothetical protein
VVQWLTDAKFLAAIAVSGQRRHTLSWARSLAPGYLLDTPSPWITFDAIEAIGRRLRAGMRVFEYGSGGSTLYWLRCGAELVSVEHDAAWFELVRSRLPRAARIDYRLVEADPPAPAPAPLDPADPAAYGSAHDAFQGRTFRRYASQIDAFPEGAFDLVLVDGRARPSCLRHAAPKVRRGGLLVLDNADRDYYLARTGPDLAGFIREVHTGVGPLNRAPWRTDVYVRS